MYHKVACQDFLGFTLIWPVFLTDKKKGSCFSEAEESEKVNCVPASVTAQHIEASIKKKLFS